MKKTSTLLTLVFLISGCATGNTTDNQTKQIPIHRFEKTILVKNDINLLHISTAYGDQTPQIQSANNLKIQYSDIFVESFYKSKTQVNSSQLHFTVFYENGRQELFDSAQLISGLKTEQFSIIPIEQKLIKCENNRCLYKEEFKTNINIQQLELITDKSNADGLITFNISSKSGSSFDISIQKNEILALLKINKKLINL